MITLATLPQATAQEVFDQVARHLLSQGVKSRNSYSCAYRGANGLKCAAGCLISDNEYHCDFEGFNWFDLVDNEDAPSDHHVLIEALQLVHDENYSPEWNKALRDVAERFSITFPSDL